MSPNRTKGFKKLQEVWYKRLEEFGFKDIEREGRLKDYHSTNWQDPQQIKRAQEAHEYYSKAAEVFYSYKFKSPKEKLVWLWHIKGKSVREIEEIWGRMFEKPLRFRRIAYIINEVAILSGLKNEQSNRKAV